MQPFNFSTSQQIICEQGAVTRLGEICQDKNIRSVMIITDPGIIKLGLHKNAVNSLEKANTSVFIYGNVHADPAESIVLEAVKTARKNNVEAIIGFGGGSSMDVAKVVSLLAHPNCLQKISNIYGINNAFGNRLPLLQIPTTAGTGSEVTQVAIVTTGATTKSGIITPLFLPDIAILDSELTTGLPAHITAATGIDAMVHAIESYTSKFKKNPMSDMFAKEALRLLSGSIRAAVANGKNQQARQDMLLGAMMAGQAFANSPVAAVHALAYPLGGHFHIPHGLSNSLVLPHVMRFNIETTAELYSQLAPIIFPEVEFTGSIINITTLFIEHIESLIKELGLPTRLSEMDISEDFLPILAKDAMKQMRLLINNPKEVTQEDALNIYQAAF